MPKTVVTLTLNEQAAEDLYSAFSSCSVPVSSPYIRYQLRPDGCVITCYKTNKVVFQGTDAEKYSTPYLNMPGAVPSTSSRSSSSSVILPQGGSDEVGTGDYFGPVCVCAAIVEEKDWDLIQRLGVRDSKTITDVDIRMMAPKLMEQIPYSLLIVPPAKYNAVHASTNLNAMKAILHNQAYLNLRKKAALPAFLMVDQFAPEKQYYSYLRNVPEVVRGLHFETKSESRYPAVGCASIIARYAFLKAMDQMSQKYQMTFAKGAGTPADDCAMAFVERYGMDELKNVAKLHFKNTEKIQRTL
ncbi:MAG: ribonuclease HIII [Galactobacillus timonensis]|nr:ribonuclease HIII [Galactobacillus timonensis]